MSFNSAEEIIPGYSLLSEALRSEFENSTEGKAFTEKWCAFVEFKQKALAKIRGDNAGWLNLRGWVNSLTGQTQSDIQTVQEEVEKEKIYLLKKISADETYKKIRLQIHLCLLQKLYPSINAATITEDLHSLLEKLRHQISHSTDQTFSQAFDSQCTRRENADIIQEIEKLFASIENELAIKLKEAKFAAHLEALCQALPLMRKSPIYQELQNDYSSLKLSDDPQSADIQRLSQIFFECMQANQNPLVDLTRFNQHEARYLASKFCETFAAREKIDFARWLSDYEKQLRLFLEASLRMRDSKSRKDQATPPLLNSLSYLWSHKNLVASRDFMKKKLAEGHEFVKQVADAKSFMHYFGITSQNDEIVLSMLDLYNCIRYKKEASESKKILIALFKPLTPLYQEYRDIALFEKSVLMKAFRLLMPIIIIVTVILIAAFLLTLVPLADFAVFAALVPAVIIGLIIATSYVSCKNKVYKAIRESYYGGLWETPEYKVTDILRAAFGNNAEAVRTFYIEALRKCDHLKHYYEKKVLLTPEEKTLNAANTETFKGLYFEWLDISANKTFKDQKNIHDLVRSRLQNSQEACYRELLQALGEESLANTAHEMTEKVKERLEECNKTSSLTPFQQFAPITFFGKVPGELVRNMKKSSELLIKLSPPSTVVEYVF